MVYIIRQVDDSPEVTFSAQEDTFFLCILRLPFTLPVPVEDLHELYFNLGMKSFP